MYLGVDYYPEHWDEKLIDNDLDRMKNMGCNIIRIGEFAWHLIERKEGKYDFSFFDKVIEKAKNKNIKIMFGTPTATFPAWLAKKAPSILSENEFGHKRVFGGRRQYCFNSDTYINYTKKIVERLVNHYKDEKDIIVWQIDNEFGHEGSDMCYCTNCHKKFQTFLKNKYENIDNLNKGYGTIFWGQTYNEFCEIPIPKPTITTHNPSLKLDWSRFRSYSINKFAEIQIDIVDNLKGDHQSITHNLPGGFFDKAYDQNILAEQLDFVSYDNYPVWGGLKEPIEPAEIAMNHDYVRGLKNKNYWIVEELMGAQGHNVIGYLPRPNQAKMWAYQAMAHGCENMLFFRWRGMNKGAEQFCYGIIDTDNKEKRKYKEVNEFMTDIKKYEDIIKSPIKSDIAILYDFDNTWSWKGQKQSIMFDFTTELMRLYKPFYNLNLNIDVIDIKKDFKKYKVLAIPVMQIIDEKLKMKIEQFVKGGGTVIFSFRSGIKDRNNNLYFGLENPCLIKELTGITIDDSESLQEDVEISSFDKRYKGKANVWRDIITNYSAEILYKYTDDFYSDKACITKNKFGKGNVYYIGAGVDEDILSEIFKEIIQKYDIDHIDSPRELEVYIRYYKDKKWLFINNHSDKKIEYKNVIIEPYESIIKKYEFIEWK
ncbi:beta-galactosidase [Senegalia massiliensis]|uniref:beta-galactosidase n=1 Tax=Senegalia massiliensis TaxID=1720316 RepID=UPI0010308989|nr:beta-galactosidase [Senegalia massiliensis]